MDRPASRCKRRIATGVPPSTGAARVYMDKRCCSTYPCRIGTTEKGNRSMRLYDFGFIIIAAGLAAAIALIVASQVS